jgi:Tfp pilus assembly protein PilF
MNRHFLTAAAFLASFALPAFAQNKTPAPGEKIPLKDTKSLEEGSVKLPATPNAALPEVPAVAAKKAPTKEDQDPTLDLLKKLKPEQVEKVRRDINDASSFVAGVRLTEALQKLDEAEQIVPDLFMIHNLKGAVFTKMRVFDKARASFQRSMELNPNSFHPKFNLAEIEFVEHHWAKAQHDFEALLKSDADQGTKKLIQFKIVICLLKQDKVAEAKKMADGFSYIDDEPVYHLSHAAIEFHEGDKQEAQSWLDSANRIYNPQVLTIYMDSFIEVGWVESLAL